MNNNLIIIGAGIYGLVAKEIAEDMGVFGKISFVDDNAKTTPNGISVIGTLGDIESFYPEYTNVIVAIGNPVVRLSIINKLENTPFRIVTLVSPKAHISRYAQIDKGSIIEPMAVVHTGAVISVGCIISAGAVVNHASLCADGVHVDCNATVAGNICVPKNTKVPSGTVYKNENQPIKKPHGPLPINGMEYSFEDGV